MPSMIDISHKTLKDLEFSAVLNQVSDYCITQLGKEKVLLERLAVRLDITNSEFEAVLKNPSKYPISSPVSYEERLEHLYDLTKMLFLDKNPTIDKTSTMDRIAVGLGFPAENARIIVKEAVKFFLKEPDVEEFKNAIKKVNQIT